MLAPPRPAWNARGLPVAISVATAMRFVKRFFACGSKVLVLSCYVLFFARRAEKAKHSSKVALPIRLKIFGSGSRKPAVHVLITGSSGQIGTNLALRLLDAGHSVFGVDKRLNAWTSRVTTLLQDLSAPYRDFAGGI